MKNTKIKIYTAGKVTGVPLEECRAKFAKTQQLLEDKGFEVVNPMNVVTDPTVSWQEAMDLCIPELSECDAIYMMPCSKYSKGAHIELEHAIVSGLDIYYELEDVVEIENITVIDAENVHN